jgi:hypothetical protein
MTLPPAFLFAPDWSAGVELSGAWKTDILQGEDGTEQRVAMRDAPAESMKYSALVLSEADVGLLALLLAQAPDGRVHMPRWCDATRLTADVAIGGTSVACDTTDRAFTVGGSLLIWRRRTGVYEVRTIAGVSDSALDITGDAATKAWVGNTDVEVLPIAPALLTLPVGRTYLGGVLASLQLACDYEIEALATTAPAASVADSIVLTFDDADVDWFNQGSYVNGRAEVLDADGIAIPEAVVSWSSTNPTIWTVQPVGLYGQLVIVRKIDALVFAITTITATCGAATTTVSLDP